MKNTSFVLLTLPATLLLSSLQTQAAVTYNSDTTLTSPVTLTDTTDTYGVVVEGGATLTFGSGGSVAINNNGTVSSSGIWTVAFRLSDGANLVMQQGSISVNDLGNTASGGEGNDAIVGIQTFGSNHTLDIGGSASVSLTSNGGARSGQLFRIGSDNSTLNISGGTFVSHEDSGSTNNTAFTLGGSGHVVNISGGTFELSASVAAGGGKFFNIDSNTQVTLSGGTFVETVGTNYQGIHFATGGASGSFELLGKLLELDTNQDGTFDTIISTDSSVSDLAGDFRITFADNTTWESNYLQQAAGQISFAAIPEPSATSILVGVSALGLIVRRRRN